jgi:methionyl-tRNA formyltransferase
MSLKIIFMGTPEFAVPTLKELLKEKLNIIHVYTQPPKKSNSACKFNQEAK